jgi:general secretion pathway protein B
MSYILDALKKAESERNLGAVPTIHAQPAFRIPSTTSTPVWRQPWIWTVFLVLGVIMAVLGWLKPWQATPVVTTVASAPTVAVPQALPEQASNNTEKVAPQTSIVQTAPPATPVAAAPSEPVVSAAPPAPAPAASPEAQVAPQKPVKSKPKAELAKRNTANTTSPTHKKPAATHATTTQSEDPVPTLRELPEQLQREIPPVAIGGYIYSPNRGDRSILIDKKLLREGDQISPNLTLEKMLPNGVILNYKGYRYRTSY